jgi:hypothetical protein
MKTTKNEKNVVFRQQKYSSSLLFHFIRYNRGFLKTYNLFTNIRVFPLSLQSDMDRNTLIFNLKEMGAFWSYSVDNLSDMPDDLLIEEALKWGDIIEIKAIFQLFPKDKVQNIWEKYLVPDYSLYPHNYYLARIFFEIDNPNLFLEKKILNNDGWIRSFIA